MRKFWQRPATGPELHHPSGDCQLSSFRILFLEIKYSKISMSNTHYFQVTIFYISSISLSQGRHLIHIIVCIVFFCVCKNSEMTQGCMSE